MNGFGYSPKGVMNYVERGKNLFNVNSPNIKPNTYLKTNGTLGNGAGVTTDYIPIIPLVKVWLSLNSVMQNTFTVCSYDENKAFIAGSYRTSYINNGYLPPANARYILINATASRVTSATQIEQGFSVTEFEPYGYNLKANNIIGKWEYPLPQTIRYEIGDVQNKCADIVSDFRFGFMTDVHIDSPTQYYKIRPFVELNKSGICDVLINCGDIAAYSGDATYRIKQLQDVVNILKDTNSDIIMARGNHDIYSKYVAGSVDDYVIPKRVWHNLCCHHQRNKAVFDVNNPLGGYYYKDYSDAKIRVIVLNTSDVLDDDGHWLGADASLEVDKQRIQQEQFTWLCSVALDFSDKDTDKSNWGVITVSHSALFGPSYGLDTQATNVEGVFNAFMTGGTFAQTTDTGTVFQLVSNVDFSSQGAMEYIAHFAGNAHWDVVANATLVPIIRTANMGNLRKTTTPTDYPTEGDIYTIVTPSRGTGGMAGDGTIECELFDVFNVNRQTKTITSVRYGAGADRIIPYGTRVALTMPTTETLTSVLSGTLTWESLNTNVATVADGVVTGVAAGSVVITATDSNGQVEAWQVDVS